MENLNNENIISAVVNIETNLVTNIIVADPTIDPAPDGFIFIALPPNSPVTIGWIYDKQTGKFTDPNPEQT